MECPNPNCKTPNPDEARFCERCGTPLPAPYPIVAPPPPVAVPPGFVDPSYAATMRGPQQPGRNYAVGKEPGIALLLSSRLLLVTMPEGFAYQDDSVQPPQAAEQSSQQVQQPVAPIALYPDAAAEAELRGLLTDRADAGAESGH